MGRRAVLVSIVSTVAALLVFAAPAAAHLRSGTVAVDYTASVLHPETDAYSAQIFQSDRALSITVKRDHTVVLVGYLGEAVLRLDGTGLWVNASSPTAAVLRLVKARTHVGSSAPVWVLQRGKDSVIWADSRSQGLPPGVSRGAWTLPLLVDGRRTRLQGELWRFPAPPLWLWLGILAGILVGGLTPIVLWRRDLAGAAAIWFGVLAACAAGVVVIAFVLDAYASPGTWIEAVDAIAFMAVGVWALLRGAQQWHFAAAIGLGLIALAVGLLEGAIFLHPVVLAVLPGTVVRFADITAVGAGLIAAVLGGLVYAEQAAGMPSGPPLEYPRMI